MKVELFGILFNRLINRWYGVSFFGGWGMTNLEASWGIFMFGQGRCNV